MIKRIHGGNIREEIKGTCPKGEIIDFSANINPLGLPLKVKREIIKKLDSLIHYPEPESASLKKTLAAFHGIKTENLLIGNGTIEFIYLIPRALRVKTALIINPTFTEYEYAVKLNGAKAFFLNTSEKKGFKINTAGFKKIIPKVDIVFLCNPNNPTGYVIPREDMLGVLRVCRRFKTIVVLDEAFIDFAENSSGLTMLEEAVKNRFLIVLRAMTKFYALSGLRLGYLVSHSSLVKKISRFQQPWNVNAPAQTAGEAVIKDKDYIEKSRKFVLCEKKRLFNGLNRIKGIKAYPPGANFILCRLKNASVMDARKLKEVLIKKNLLIRSCGDFRGLGDSFFRVAVRRPNENKKLVSALKQIIEEV